MRIFKRKKKAKQDLFEQGNFNIHNINIFEEHEFLVSLAYKSHAVDTVYPACASCYGISEDKNKEYEKRLGYIGRRVKSLHTSILEHSNVVIQVFIPLEKSTENLFDSVRANNKFIKNELIDYDTTDQDIISLVSEVRDVCRYLTIVTDTFKNSRDNHIMRMTIGGSIRGFRYIFENIENRQNKLFISIFRVLKLVVEPEFFIDFINDGVMEEYTTIDIDEKLLENVPQEPVKIINATGTDKIDIINADRLDTISKLTGLPKEKCFDFVSITVDFKNMSRIITQQVTRHRNGITQESQRYVNYSGSKVNSPVLFKDKYDKDHVYETPIGNLTFDQLGELMTKVYDSLVKQAVDKEDARGYLPLNVQCGKLFMTFTLRTLFMFLNLRLDTHAQSEVRGYANILSDTSNMYAESLGLDDMQDASKYYSLPKYKRDQEQDLYLDINEEV